MIRKSSQKEHILEQENCPKGNEICRDYRILGAEKVGKGTWIIFRALDDGRGFFNKKIIETIYGSRIDVIRELDCYKD